MFFMRVLCFELKSREFGNWKAIGSFKKNSNYRRVFPSRKTRHEKALFNSGVTIKTDTALE